MNIVFMGTPDFAVEALSKIYEMGHNVLAVVSQPDKPAGRGMSLAYTPTKEYAIAKNIKVLQPEKIKHNEEFYQELKKLNPDVLVVAAYGKILPKEILELPKYGAINIHASLLPKYRGSAPIQWAIINGEEKTGVTTMYMDVGMDTGDILDKEEVVIDYDETYGTLYEKLKKVGGRLILKTLDKIADGVFSRIKQPEEYTMAPMIEKYLGNIDWTKSANDIRNLIRGFNPMPGAFTHLDDKIMKIWSADVVDVELEEGVIPGTILVADTHNGLQVATGSKVLKINVLQMPNAKKMDAIDYLRGNKIDAGSILYN